MRDETRELSRTVDPEVLGARVRSARLRRGLTQAQVAGDDISTAYISRIEAGQRRPDPEVIENIATRLALTPEDLIVGVNDTTIMGLQVEADHAQLALATGSPADALDRTETLLAHPSIASLPDLRRQVIYTHAIALERTGDLEAAIDELEKITRDVPQDLDWLTALTALSRCLRESGDLARAVDVGEAALRFVEGHSLEHSTEAIVLGLTIVAAYSERGDVAHAARMCRTIIARAEDSDSLAVRAGAYWNASVVEMLRGNMPLAQPMARKALGLIEQTDDAINVARLRSQLGILLLADPYDPQPEEALDHLTRGATELELTGSSPADLGDNLLAQARARFLLGDIEPARRQAERVHAATASGFPLVCAGSLVLQGQIAAHTGDAATARDRYQSAVMVLSGIGADRAAAQLWFDLAALLEEVGEPALALDAYRSAAASTGLARRSPSARSRDSGQPSAR